MNEFICFPVDFDEKERFQRICQKLDLKPEEWFRRAIIESEIDLAARNHSDPDTEQNPSDPKAYKKNSPRLEQKSSERKHHPDNNPNEGKE